MTSDNPRLTRLQRECDIAVGPVWLLAAACVVLVLLLGLDPLFGKAAPTQVEVAAPQTTAPAP